MALNREGKRSKELEDFDPILQGIQGNEYIRQCFIVHCDEDKPDKEKEVNSNVESFG